MARLEGIIRVRKWELDEKRRVLVALERERSAIIDRMDAIDREVIAEREAASLEVGPVSLGAFMNGAKIRLDQLSAELAIKDQEILVQHEEVSEAFRELKTFEIAEEQEKARIKKDLEHKEQVALDEQGVQSFLRGDE